MKIKESEHNGHQYWVTIEPAIHTITKETIYIAYVSDTEPGGLLFGKLLRDGKGNVMLFDTELTALTNAYLVKNSEIESRQKK